ncbi:ribosomal protein S18-alanine N-acetyltransferase [Venatoribacter cucullus]|uniref:ribosomal protein S18-alanine N-acetyltransferase n=1 Tax=Venatoribacter cucullus TaxID=2661630 RepID=UPI00223F6109|nr:ribosomal protein S18-alanine N-acetyltransferase [Venatoribacter cucullus]UZK04414.1 ribosomal-protein-alanine N-acetyltransferase [Venatoribacter cucullus]
MLIRMATEQDIPAILAIERAAHFHPWPESVLRRYLAKSGCVQVLEQDGRVLAYAVNTLIAGEAELLMIAVDPNQQGRGYGRTLMNHLQQQLQQQGAEQWFLDVRASNEPAIGLYESLGFCQAGCRPNYYPTAHGSEDALLYCMDLQP